MTKKTLEEKVKVIQNFNHKYKISEVLIEKKYGKSEVVKGAVNLLKKASRDGYVNFGRGNTKYKIKTIRYENKNDLNHPMIFCLNYQEYLSWNKPKEIIRTEETRYRPSEK